MKLSKALEGFLLSRQADGYSPSTLVSYQRYLTLLSRENNDPEVSAITLAMLERYMAWLRSGYIPERSNKDNSPLSTSTVQNAWKAIRSFFNWAVEVLSIERPDQRLKCPRVTYPEIVPFDEPQIRAIAKACEYTRQANTEQRKPFTMRRPTAKRDKALIMLLLDTGLRAGEAARLLVRDVNFSNGEIYVRPFGSGRKTKSRVVYLGRSAQRALWLYLAGREHNIHDPLFLGTGGRPMNRGSINHLCADLGTRAGVDKCHPHRFRHTFAIQYLRNGGDVFTLQRLLGHSSLDMVKRYLALADADAQAVHNRASPVDRLRL